MAPHDVLHRESAGCPHGRSPTNLATVPHRSHQSGDDVTPKIASLSPTGSLRTPVHSAHAGDNPCPESQIEGRIGCPTLPTTGATWKEDRRQQFLELFF